MKAKTPTSFIIFLIALSLTVGVFTAAILFDLFHWDRKKLIYLAFTQFWVAIIAPLGIYSAARYKSHQLSARRKNRLGLWGNLILFAFTATIMINSIIQ
jgi:hypothetical protein